MKITYFDKDYNIKTISAKTIEPKAPGMILVDNSVLIDMAAVICIKA